MFLTCVFAPCLLRKILAWRTPGRDIEILSSNQPVHTTLFGPARYELKTLAYTFLTSSIEFLAEIPITMVGHPMSAETFRVLSQSKALRFFLLVPIRNLS